MTDSHGRSAEEASEMKRHDDLYEDHHPWRLQTDEWTRFDRPGEVVHGYNYSVQDLGDLSGKRVLDLGCGIGWFSVILAKRGAHVSGVDISERAISTARQMARLNDVVDRAQFKVGSAYTPPFPTASFDLVAGQAILHHLRDKQAAAEAIHSMLKPSGRAVFFEAFGASPALERLRLLVPVEVAEEDKTHWREQMTYEDIRSFEDLFEVKVREFHLFSRLDRIFSQPSLIRFLGCLDNRLLGGAPFLRRYARTVVVSLGPRPAAVG